MKTSHLKSACRTIPVAVAIGVAVGTPGTAIAAVDMFLAISGLQGESLDKQYKGSIDVYSFNQSVSRSACPRFQMAKGLDKATPGLDAASNDRTNFQTVTFRARKAGITPFEFYKLDMTNVKVSSVEQSMDGANTPLESIVLLPASVTVTYTPQNADGTAGTPVITSYSCQTTSGTPP
jgi:type VI protein secretion system component Hcp